MVSVVCQMTQHHPQAPLYTGDVHAAKAMRSLASKTLYILIFDGNNNPQSGEKNLKYWLHNGHPQALEHIGCPAFCLTALHCYFLGEICQKMIVSDSVGL